MYTCVLLRLIVILSILSFTSCCIAASISSPRPLQPTRPSTIHRLGLPYATCLSVVPSQGPHPKATTVDAFGADCLGAWIEILKRERFASIRWRWRRPPQDRSLRPGYASLPFTEAHGSCTISLDVLDDESAEDRQDLFSLGVPLRALYDECIRPEQGGPAAGFIPVGARKLLKLAIAPTAEDEGDNTLRHASNYTRMRTSVRQ